MSVFNQEAERFQILLFIDVQNINEIIEYHQNQTNNLWIAFNLENVLNQYHIEFSMLKSLINIHYNHTKSRQIWSTEFLYQLSTSSSVRESVSIFGINENSNAIGFVILDDKSNEISTNLKELTKGTQITDNELKNQQLTPDKITRLIKLNKINEMESKICSLESSILTKIAMKDI